MGNRSMTEDPQGDRALPVPLIRARRWVPSLVWLVPTIAALVGLSLLINTWRAAGPRITIGFQTAEGLEVGKTLVKYRNVTIGHVTAIALSADRKSVIVTADLAKSGQVAANYDTQFWVVRPRFGVGWVSGLDTLCPAHSSVPSRENPSCRVETLSVSRILHPCCMPARASLLCCAPRTSDR